MFGVTLGSWNVQRFGAALAALLLLGTPLGCGGKSSAGGDSGITPDASALADADVEPDANYGICGDGILNTGEECDDGNQHDDDECLPNCTWACGDGIVNAVELCDTGIAAGETGACPTDCDDANACTTETLVGSECQAECVYGDITACANGDGCCPTACDETTDDDCNAICDNGVIEAGETCDPISSCPTSCDDSNACTVDTLTGTAATCDAACSNTPVTACTNGDGCCPTGCNQTTDDDCNPACGNGVVESGESCDPPGSCPTTCNDNNVCTADTMTGASATCNVVCSNAAITLCTNGDGCCPSGCDSTSDNDCAVSCGNSIIEAGETCDPPGSCPTTCNDNNVCTTDVMTGAAATCNAACTNTPVTSCADSDGCCPAGCDSTTDNDCSVSCGNGVVESGETCDPISTCPTTCNDNNACTVDQMTGAAATCNVACSYTPITSCVHGDGCCPAGCFQTTDSDCTPSCGNGVVESGETCDPPGSCPTTCNDNNACTADVMSGAAATCNAVCSNTPITSCANGDGCCPSGCNSTIDNDCNPVCGNTIVETGETCDPPSSCPTTCDDSNFCTTDQMTGASATCDVACSNTPVTTCTDNDSCCPSGCYETTDNDCTPVCGNGVVETGEACDDGGTLPGDGCNATCQLEPTVFRLSDLDLRDPHVFADLPWLGCNDITDSIPFGLGDSINDMLQDGIQTDDDGDGDLDLSFLVIYRPFDQSTPHSGNADIAMGLCSAPMAGTVCDPDPSFTLEPTVFTNESSGVCLDALPGTVRPYSPAISVPTAPPVCFHTTTFTLTVNLGGILIPLEDVQIGATYLGNPSTSMNDGLMRGFLSEADADAIILPADIDVVGGQPLSSLLRGGTGCCRSGDDRDTGTDGVTVGWWFYFNFPADLVTYTGP